MAPFNLITAEVQYVYQSGSDTSSPAEDDKGYSTKGTAVFLSHGETFTERTPIRCEDYIFVAAEPVPEIEVTPVQRTRLVGELSWDTTQAAGGGKAEDTK